MRVVIVGAGAVGMFYGAKLAQAGCEVVPVCRTAADAVRACGVDIESPWGDFTFRPERVYASVEDFARDGRVADWVLVATKVLPDIDVAELIRPAVTAEHTGIVLLQNGVEIETPVAAAFPGNCTVSGLAFTCISRVGPRHIRHLDYGRVTLGDYPAGAGARTREVADRLAAAGVPTVVSTDIVRDRWLKLVWNAPFNPMSALAPGATTRDLLDDPETHAAVRAVMGEVRTVAAAAGHPLPDDCIEKNIAATLAMKPYKTSMCLDLEAGRPLEVEAILGNAVRAARRTGTPAPRLELLYALLRQVDPARLLGQGGL